MSKILSICILGFLISCSSAGKQSEPTPAFAVSLDTLKWYDKSRQREIPIAIYKPAQKKIKGQNVVILSHGYGANRGGDYLHYSNLASFLASRGFFVVSIQHELPTDSLIPSTGIPQIVRRPFWERGADNILFVINELKKTNPDLNYQRITLIGHSNGGDMTALFPQKYPNVVNKIITLDNRRMALPRTTKPGVYSLRSNEFQADENVLPTEAEARKFGIKIIKLPNTKHAEMSDDGNEAQRKEIQGYVLSFLKE